MNVDLRPSTRRMIEESPVAAEARTFIERLHAEHYRDYVIDCHIRRLLFVMPRLSSGASPPILQDAELAAEFARERHPRSRFFNFAGTRRVYTRYLRGAGVPERGGTAPGRAAPAGWRGPRRVVAAPMKSVASLSLRGKGFLPPARAGPRRGVHSAPFKFGFAIN